MSTAARPPAPVSPPPVGESLMVAWETFQRGMGPIVVASLCAMLLALVPLLGGGLAFAGLMQVALKALRGKEPLPSDGLIGLSESAVDHIVMGLLQIAGILACCVGVYVSQAIFFPGTLLILERGMTWDQAKDVCLQQVKPNWGAWTLFVLVVGLVGASGALLCGVGALFTVPVAMIALAHAYRHAFGAEAAS